MRSKKRNHNWTKKDDDYLMRGMELEGETATSLARYFKVTAKTCRERHEKLLERRAKAEENEDLKVKKELSYLMRRGYVSHRVSDNMYSVDSKLLTSKELLEKSKRVRFNTNVLYS